MGLWRWFTSGLTTTRGVPTDDYGDGSWPVCQNCGELLTWHQPRQEWIHMSAGTNGCPSSTERAQRRRNRGRHKA